MSVPAAHHLGLTYGLKGELSGVSGGEWPYLPVAGTCDGKLERPLFMVLVAWCDLCQVFTTQESVQSAIAPNDPSQSACQSAEGPARPAVVMSRVGPQQCLCTEMV